LADVLQGIRDLIKNPDVKLEPTGPDVAEWNADIVTKFSLSALPYTKGQKVWDLIFFFT
jgi:hypothetical protein